MTAPVAPPRADLDPNTMLWLRAYTETKAKIAELEQMAEQARRHVEAALGDNEEGVVDGQIVVRWTHVTSNRLDTKKLKENHPDLVEQFSRPQVTRRFTIPDAAAVTS